MTREEKQILARELQENPLWGEVLSDLRERNIKAWTAAQDTEERERCWAYNHTIDALTLAIRNALNFTPEEE